jgi:K+-sensing histidine kinase KdpD
LRHGKRGGGAAVGKTFAMRNEGKRLKAEGHDVVGFIEPGCGAPRN